MPTAKSLGAALSVNTSSKHPTASDSVHVDTEPFSKVEDSSPTVTLNPIVTNVTVKHTSPFNCERDSGMSKFQQTQFVEALKKTIIGIRLLPCDGCALMGNAR